ncbi:MAG TPA: hypothetical protein VNH22_16085 [Blastocatellia bacterium]|jgi:hypothetical protein|nr:hypothetical protein [Blastocatellia bacterium]
MIKYPFENLSAAGRARLFLPLLVITSLVTSAMVLIGRPLSADEAVAPKGIVSFEMARSADESQAIMSAWGEKGRIRAGFSLGLDFLFIFAYATTISLGCVMGSAFFGGLRFGGRKWLALAGVALAWGQAAAGILDGIENTALISMLLYSASESLRLMAYWSAWIKFKLVYAGILYAVAGGVVWGIGKVSARGRNRGEGKESAGH